MYLLETKGHVALAAIIDATKRVPANSVKSLQFIWIPGMHRILLEPDLQMSYKDLTITREYQLITIKKLDHNWFR